MPPPLPLWLLYVYLPTIHGDLEYHLAKKKNSQFQMVVLAALCHLSIVYEGFDIMGLCYKETT